MSNAAITTAFFRVVDKRTKADILANIAKGKAAVTPQTPWMTAVQIAAVLHVEL